MSKASVAVRSIFRLPAWQTVMPSSFCCLLAFLLLLSGICWGLLLPQQYALAAGGETVPVEITGTGTPPGFLPDLVSIHVHDSITFINQSRPAQMYTIAANDGSFFSGSIAPGAQWKVTLTKAGMYEYHAVGANLHMVGSILVAPPSVMLLPTPVPGAIASEVANIRKAPKSGVEPSTAASLFHQQSVIALSIVLLILAALVIGGSLLWRARHSSNKRSLP